jgi:hypothetical protein
VGGHFVSLTVRDEKNGRRDGKKKEKKKQKEKE